MGDIGKKTIERNNIYQLIRNLNKYCNSTLIIYFFRVHTYQAALEGLVTFYIAQLWIVFSPYFSNRPLTNKEFFAFVIISLFLSTIVYAVYMIILYVNFIRTISASAKKIHETSTLSNLEKHHTIEHDFKITCIWTHIFGAILYGILGAVICYIYVRILDNDAIKMPILLIYKRLVVIGLVVGVFWNIQDYHADMRLNWPKLISDPIDLTDSERDIIEQKKFRHIITHAVLTISIMFAILVLITVFVYIICTDRSCPSNANPLFNGDFIQNAYVLLFGSILVLYTKTLFSLYYGEHSELYLPITDFGNPKEKRNRKQDCEMHE